MNMIKVDGNAQVCKHPDILFAIYFKYAEK